jgi:RHS repeat-associated protein
MQVQRAVRHDSALSSYFGARYYMPALGRWAAVDPIADRFAGWSGYDYMMGNPSELVDPDGLAPCNSGQESTSECIGRLWEAAPDVSTVGDPSGSSAGCIPCLVVAVELASAAYDIYATRKAFGRGAAEGAEALQYTMVGALASGPGQA